MSHPDEGILQELLDGELPPADAAAVRAHLAGCVPCAVALRDLAAIQSESDAIVARLPLDPPLVKPGARTQQRRRWNVRALGLAASVMLVAGTSWLLFRTAPQKFSARDEAPAGLVLPMPSEERQEVPPTTPAMPPPAAAPTATPAAPPAAKLRADANGDQAAKAKQAPAEAAAPAAQSTAKDQAPLAELQRENEVAAKTDVEKKEADQVSTRGRSAADAPALAPGPAAPAPAALPATGGKASGNTTITLAEAEARLGTRLRTIAGLTPMSVEMLPLVPDSLVAVRQRYMVYGMPVTLTQQSAKPRHAVSSKARDAASYVDGVVVQPGNRGNGFVTSDSAKVPGAATRAWLAGGSLFLLQGDLVPDSLDALVKRVK